MAEILNEQCRTCLLKETEMIYLMADHVVCDKVMSVLELIKICTSAQIEFEDGYPQFICMDCIHSAEKSYEFRVQCEKADKSLRSQIELLDKNMCTISELERDDDDKIECNDIVDENYEILESEFENDNISDDQVNYLNLEEGNTADIKCEEIEMSDTEYSCKVCELIFPTPAALRKHTTSAHELNFYQCPHCPVRFITNKLLSKHLIKHNTDSKKKLPGRKTFAKEWKFAYVCAVCGKKYSSLNTLNSHIRKHSSSKQNKSDNATEQPVFICHECDHHFVTAADLQLHMESIHNLKSEDISTSKFRCKFCLLTFPNNENLQKHIDDTHNKKRKTTTQSKLSYECKICYHNAKTLPEIKDHLSTHEITSKEIFNNLSYKCAECDEVFKTIYDYFSHSSVTHSGNNKIESSPGSSSRIIRRPYVCNAADCNKAFPAPSALKKHSLTHESQWPKKCRYCDDVVNKWHDYMIHLNENHDDKKTFICSQCGKKFFRERNLQSHMKTHTGERNYMCDFCGFSFHAQNNLVAHRRIHTGVKPYKCTYCPQAFSQHAGLRSHLLNHTGEKTHECPTCCKKFLRIGALKNHIKTHTGVKDYACHICGARFGASSTRKKHLLTHTGERNHICDFCGKAFSRRSNLSVHRKIHTGETPHVCEICGRGFIQAHVLRSHMNTHKKQTNEGVKKSPKKGNQAKINVQEDSENITVLVEFN